MGTLQVWGKEEMVTIRQEDCRVLDCIGSCILNMGHCYTGSKAEGVDLPGSDNDYMHDIDNLYNIRVV